MKLSGPDTARRSTLLNVAWQSRYYAHPARCIYASWGGACSPPSGPETHCWWNAWPATKSSTATLFCSATVGVSLPIVWWQERAARAAQMFRRKGDAVPHLDSPVPGGNLLGKVSFIVRNGKRIPPRKSLRFSERAVAAVFRRSPLAARVFVGVHGLRQTSQGPSQIQTP